MDFDETKKMEVEISENNFVENRIGEKKPRLKRRLMSESGLDVLDLVIIPIAIGVFVSLGFLFSNLLKITEIENAFNQLFTGAASIF